MAKVGETRLADDQFDQILAKSSASTGNQLRQLVAALLAASGHKRDAVVTRYYDILERMEEHSTNQNLGR